MSVWLDRDPLAANWPAPRRGVRWRWIILAVVLCVAVLGTGLWAGGGLAERNDQRILVDPGVVFETGPYQITFTDASIWEKKGYGSDPKPEGWEVRVYGYGRTTGTKSDQLSGSHTAIGVAGSGFAESGTVTQVGSIRDYGAQFQPGMPMVPLEIEAELPVDFVPGDHIDVIVARLRIINRSLDGGSTGEVLRPTPQHFLVRLPLVMQPGDPPD